MFTQRPADWITKLREHVCVLSNMKQMIDENKKACCMLKSVLNRLFIA